MGMPKTAIMVALRARLRTRQRSAALRSTCSHSPRACPYRQAHDQHTPSCMQSRLAGRTSVRRGHSRINANDSEWNSRWYKIHTTPALPSANASGENSQPAAAKAK